MINLNICEFSRDIKRKIIEGGYKLVKPHKIVCVNEFTKPSEPVIYASNHGTYHDLAVGMCVIDDRFSFLAANENLDLSGKAVYNMVGSILVDRRDSDSRNASKKKCIDLLRDESLFACYEGTWNLEEALLMTKLHLGMADVFMTSGRDIYPLAIEPYGGTYYIKFGEKLSPEFVLSELGISEYFCLSGLEKYNSMVLIAEYIRGVIGGLRLDILEHNNDYTYEDFLNENARRIAEYSTFDKNIEEQSVILSYPKYDINYKKVK